jgi:uncharacterized protein
MAGGRIVVWRADVAQRIRAGAAGALCLSTLLSAASSAPLADAAQRGDQAVVAALLKQGTDVNAAQGDGMTALHWAAMNDEAELAALLLQAGANANPTTRIGAYTPLLLAARSGNARVIEWLLKGGADVNAKTANGTTALMFAAASGDVSAVTSLIAHGAELNAKESTRGLTAAMFAAASNSAAVITALAQHGAALNRTTSVIDLRALDRNAFAAVLFGNPRPPAGSRPDGAERTTAPDAGARPEQRTAGVDRDYQPNELVFSQGGMTALLLAARQGFFETTTALLDAGVDINQSNPGDQTTPLLIATINGYFDLAKFLLDRGADPNRAAQNGVTPLYAAINVEWARRSRFPESCTRSRALISIRRRPTSS